MDVTQEPGTDHRANLELYANAHLVLVHRARSHAEAAMRAADKAEADYEALRRSLPPALVDGRGASGAADDMQGAEEVRTCLMGQESAADEQRRAVALVRPQVMGTVLPEGGGDKGECESAEASAEVAEEKACSDSGHSPAGRHAVSACVADASTAKAQADAVQASDMAVLEKMAQKDLDHVPPGQDGAKAQAKAQADAVQASDMAVLEAFGDMSVAMKSSMDEVGALQIGFGELGRRVELEEASLEHEGREGGGAMYGSQGPDSLEMSLIVNTESENKKSRQGSDQASHQGLQVGGALGPANGSAPDEHTSPAETTEKCQDDGDVILKSMAAQKEAERVIAKYRHFGVGPRGLPQGRDAIGQPQPGVLRRDVKETIDQESLFHNPRVKETMDQEMKQTASKQAVHTSSVPARVLPPSFGRRTTSDGSNESAQRSDARFEGDVDWLRPSESSRDDGNVAGSEDHLATLLKARESRDRKIHEIKALLLSLQQ